MDMNEIKRGILNKFLSIFDEELAEEGFKHSRTKNEAIVGAYDSAKQKALEKISKHIYGR